MVSQPSSPTMLASNNNNYNYDKLKMVCAQLYIPKDYPNNPRGDDASFVCAEAETAGVADGVGSWWRVGVDPGKYALQLMHHAKSAVEKVIGQPVNPMAILSAAHSKTTADGSSTALIAAHHAGILRAANVGDSRFAVFRRHKVFFASEAQQRSFNHPYQLRRGGGERNGPEIAAEIEVAVQENDVVVLGTDGVWDNVFIHEIERALDEFTDNENGLIDLERFVGVVTNMANCNSQFVRRRSPFSLASQLAGKNYSGGKSDDITVIVAQIIKA